MIAFSACVTLRLSSGGLLYRSSSDWCDFVSSFRVSTFTGFSFDCCSACRMLPGIDKVFFTGELAFALTGEGAGLEGSKSSGFPVLVTLFFLRPLGQVRLKIPPEAVLQVSSVVVPHAIVDFYCSYSLGHTDWTC